MSSGIYSIGVTGMQAAQLGLMTAEHNISNASTPGYNRQRTVQATNNPIMTGAGAVGQGTHVQTIERLYNQYLSNQVNRSQSTLSELDAYYSQISQIDNMLAGANSGLSPALQDFFKGLQQVASAPQSLTTRQSMVSSTEALVDRYHGLENRLTEIADGVNGQMFDIVSSVNSYAQQIVGLNERIIVAQSSVNQPPNDLLDQRDQLVADLNKLVKVTTTTDSNGALNVFIGSGQHLVSGLEATTMVSTAAASDPERIVIGLKSVGNNIQELPEKLIIGGQLGGLVRFRSETLDTAFNQLGKVATSMALTFNAQHALGQDLLGNINGDPGFVANYFTLSQPRVVANAANAAGGPSVSATLTTQLPSNGSNFYTNLTDSDYRLSYTGGNFTLTRLSDNKQWTDTSIANINTQLASDPQGFTLNATAGAFTNNDSFLIQPTREAARNLNIDSRIAADPRLIAAAAPIRTLAAATNTGTMILGQGSVQSGYSVAALPVTITTIAPVAPATSPQLSGFPAGVTALYSDGSSPAVVGGAVNLVNGSATLTSVSFNGMTFDISGAPSVGDSFTLQRNTSSNGVSDGRNILLLGKLQTQNTVAGGTVNYQGAYAQMVGDIGNRTKTTEVSSDAQKSLLDQATAARESLSGVNLDEEAANLIRFQQAYQAAAKMLDIGTKLFDTLLTIG
ncbi:MAG: flagellar hook-associated protein FlgK [Betaproteobacteria bacterium]